MVGLTDDSVGIAEEIRDSLLLDMLAASTLLEHLEVRLQPDAIGQETHSLLHEVRSTLDSDVVQLRRLITRLSQAAAEVTRPTFVNARN